MNFSSPNALWTLPPTLGRGKVQARGFSLLEVAIALVIFVFGALAIVRIFPGALRVITVGGSRQNALNLNRAAMARVQSSTFTAPYATYDVGDNASFSLLKQGWVDGYQGDTGAAPPVPAQPRAVLGSVNRGYSLPRTTNQSDFNISALGSIRAIIGEGTTVRQTSDTTPALFVLTQFPIYNDSEFRVCEEENVTGVTVDGTGKLDFSNARFDSGEQLSNSSTDRPDNTYLRNTNTSFDPNLVYYVTYRYKATVGGATYVWGINDEPLVLNKDTDPVPYNAQVAQGSNVIPGAVVVHLKREVTAQPSTGTFGTTTYTNDDGARGLILNVTGRFVGDGVTNPRNIQAGDKVTLDYQADWQHILQEGAPDIVPENLAASNPNPTLPRQIALAAPFIEDHAPDAVLTTLYTKSSNNAFTLSKGSWGEGVTANGMLEPTPADLRASRITFDLGTNSNQTARVSYRTRDQWSQQMSVAAAAYKPYVASQIEPWRDYYLSGSTLYFHASEAGKSVMVTYSYNTGGTTPTVVTLRNRLLSIADDPRITPPSGFPYNFTSQLILTDANGDNLDDVGATVVSISGVRGASVTVRTAWLDGSRYTQSFLTAMRAGTSAEAMP